MGSRENVDRNSSRLLVRRPASAAKDSSMRTLSFTAIIVFPLSERCDKLQAIENATNAGVKTTRT